MKETKKTVYLIRHAESEENRRISSLTTVLTGVLMPWKKPLPTMRDVRASFELLNVEAQLDSGVSPVGLRQIEHMGSRLRQDRFLEEKNVQLIVHSPLRRARETCEGMLGVVVPESLPSDDSGESSFLIPELNRRVVELQLLKERTPQEWLPFNRESYEERILATEEWLLRQREDIVAIVGHSQFFKTMLGLNYKFGNCEVWELQLHHSSETTSSTSDETGEYKTLPRGWRNLNRLYDCENKL